ncbi:unnamed protein product [Allacma fusca]|uniref:C2H2-type domain-containing protein n=1 Tax=Allacma fusca TaxID=39272 RepID=A0A8J2JFU3_9HEXA|nr:unnamed protein product [Allacma fusca]
MGVVVWYQYLPEQIEQDVESLFTEVHEPLVKLLQQSLDVHNSIVVRFRVPMVLENDEYQKVYVSYMMSQFMDLFNRGGIEDLIYRGASQVINRLNVFNEHGSKWRLREIESLEVQIASLKLFTEVKVKGYLPLPFASKKGYLNIRNKNNKCFQYCIIANKYWKAVKKTHRSHSALTNPKYYERHMNDFNFDCIGENGLNIYQDLPKFEQLNNIGVTVFSHRSNEIVMVRKSDLVADTRVNLFLIHRQNGDIESDDECHFVLITNLNKFLCLGRSHRSFFCAKCYRRFPSIARLEKHTASQHPTVINEDVEFPNPAYSLKFSNYSSTLPMPYIIFWDFETYTNEVTLPNSGQNKKSRTQILNEFSPASFSIVVVHNFENESRIVDIIYYDGPDVVRTFFEKIFNVAYMLLSQIRRTNNFIQPTPDELQHHVNATSCFLCGREFSSDTKCSAKCLHHDHNTGKYIDAACSACNLNIKYKFEVPAICHNSSRFDIHILMEAISTKGVPTTNVSILARSSEEFISLKVTTNKYKLPPLLTTYDSNYRERTAFHTAHSSLYPPSWKPTNVTIQFLDSYKFLNSSLSELFSVLKKDNSYKFSLIKLSFPYLFKYKTFSPTVENVDMLLQKISFPYQALKGSYVLQPGYPIPNRESFANDLDGTQVSDEQYQRVQEVINHF